MPTKEEIWNKNVAGWRLSMTDKGHANAMIAMDEYAKQQAIAFGNFLREKIPDEYTPTTEQLYNIFENQSIEQQTKE